MLETVLGVLNAVHAVGDLSRLSTPLLAPPSDLLRRPRPPVTAIE